MRQRLQLLRKIIHWRKQIRQMQVALHEVASTRLLDAEHAVEKVESDRVLECAARAKLLQETEFSLPMLERFLLNDMRFEQNKSNALDEKRSAHNTLLERRTHLNQAVSDFRRAELIADRAEEDYKKQLRKVEQQLEDEYVQRLILEKQRTS